MQSDQGKLPEGDDISADSWILYITMFEFLLDFEESVPQIFHVNVTFISSISLYISYGLRLIAHSIFTSKINSLETVNLELSIVPSTLIIPLLPFIY